jgi:hypothetical protein
MMTSFRVWIVGMASVCLTSCGWNSSEFSEGKARGMLEAKPVPLESEQVSLTRQQVDCGIGADLWDSPQKISGERVVSRLNSAARNLKFSDDVAVEETGYRLPYAQVRGAFMLRVNEITSIRDAKEPGVKIVEAKAGIKVNHSCLAAPLPIMGVKHGTFSADVPASFEFSLQNDGWHVDGMIH